MDAKQAQHAPYGFFQNHLGELVDLMDSGIMNHLNDHELYLTAIHELGYALMYMNYIHPEGGWADQRSRVEELCEEFKQANTYRKTDFQWWRGFIYRIMDETENMC